MFATKLISSFVVMALAIGLSGTVADAANKNKNRNLQVVQGLVAAAVNVQADDVVVVDLENVLRGSDIDILNNALNNNNIEVITVKNSDVLNNLDLDVDVLNDLVDIGAIDIDVTDVDILRKVIVAVNSLGGQTIFVL